MKFCTRLILEGTPPTPLGEVHSSVKAYKGCTVGYDGDGYLVTSVAEVEGEENTQKAFVLRYKRPERIDRVLPRPSEPEPVA